jgi:Flp pilus assembly protein CpaB
MRRSRIILVLLLVVLIGLALVVVLMKLVPKTEPQTLDIPTPMVTPTVDMIDVVIAAQNIPNSTKIEEGMLQVAPYPKDLRLPNMYTNPNDVLGKIALFSLPQGTVIQEGMVADPVAEFAVAHSDAAEVIPAGWVAVSIPINRLSSVSYAPRRGDHVNVIATILLVDLESSTQSKLPNQSALVIAPGPIGEPGNSPTSLALQITGGGDASALGQTLFDTLLEQNVYVVPSEAQRPRMVSQTIIRNVRVLGVGDFPRPDLEPTPIPTAAPVTEGGVQPTEAAPAGVVPEQGQPEASPTATPAVPPPPDLITLIVSPQDAVTLNYLIYSGAILNLALRNPYDEDPGISEAVTLDYLLSGYSITIPVKEPYGLEPRVDILSQPVLPNDSAATPVP